jgi:hypothetical protein
MEKRIFVLIDFSAYTNQILSFCQLINQQDSALEFVLMHRIIVPVPALTDAHTKEELVDVERKKILPRMEDIKKNRFTKGTRLSFYISDEPLQISISSLKSPKYQDLILMGLKGAGTMQQMLMGSTNISMIEELDIPVVSLPLGFELSPKTSLIIGAYYKYEPNMKWLVAILHLLEKFSSDIKLISALQEGDNSKQAEQFLINLSSKLKEIPLPIHTAIYEGANALNSLKKEALNGEHQILILQKGNRSWKDKLVRTFIINELIYEGQNALIVLP